MGFLYIIFLGDFYAISIGFLWDPSVFYVFSMIFLRDFYAIYFFVYGMGFLCAFCDILKGALCNFYGSFIIFLCVFCGISMGFL
jgi:hypothetical protein